MSSIFMALSLFFKELVMFVAYVKNNAFPQPLPEADEEKYLRLMAVGDAYARNKLIEHNLRLVAHIVKKFENTGEDSEDLISIGTIGLIKAIESYQVDKGTKLATYAARCIENEILLAKALVKYGCLSALSRLSFQHGGRIFPYLPQGFSRGLRQVAGGISQIFFDGYESEPDRAIQAGFVCIGGDVGHVGNAGSAIVIFADG